MIGHFGVAQVSMLLGLLIVREPGQQGSFGKSSLLERLSLLALLEDHCLFPVLVHRESLHRMGFVVHVKTQQTPARLWRAHVSGVHILLQLVDSERQFRAVVSFVSVLIQILDGFNGTAVLHVQMTRILLGEVRVVGNHVTSIHHVRSLATGLRRFSSTIPRISVIAQDSLLAIFFGIALGANVAVHAHAARVSSSARSVHLTGEQDSEQLRLTRITLVWQLRADAVVNIRWRPRLVCAAHDQQNVGVRETALLELDHPSPCDDHAKDMVLYQITHESTELHVKDARHQVGSALRGLASPEVVHDLWPRRIRRHRQEKIWLAVPAHDAHSVHVILMHGARATRIRRREYDLLTNLR